MAVKKVTKPVVSEKNPIKEEDPKAMYISKGIRLFHPWQKKYIDTSEPVEMEMDSWLKSQIEAGLIRQC